MSKLDHITGAAFVGPTEAQYLQWLDEAAGEQKRLEEQRDRLLAYVQASEVYIDMLNRRIPPSNSSYWPLIDAYRFAREDLIDAGDLEPRYDRDRR